ncbi:hypothetical protein OH76DRAFT_1406730 [Lentinus brumalis]|uniref:Uncharacterized protein n=1 Tax=Lentinus brumalis TaxID=2498619 RepID=A0A371D2A1_9APHY|nr:hypothetical protein OH76DRAFT_1406730 [Polyporus brumalis]
MSLSGYKVLLVGALPGPLVASRISTPRSMAGSLFQNSYYVANIINAILYGQSIPFSIDL